MAAHQTHFLHMCSLSGSALEAAAAGQGITLAQSSFASVDLDLWRLVRLSDHPMEMPEPYFICWSPVMLETETTGNFLNWVVSEARGA